MEKSIENTLKHVSTYQAQQRALSNWAENWKEDQVNTINRLRMAAMRDDHGEIMHMIDQLCGMTEKRFTALNNVLYTISDPDRKLIDLRENAKPAQESIEDPPSETIPDPPIEEAKVLPISEKIRNDEKSLEIDEIVARYKQGTSVKEIAATGNISDSKVIKILVTAGAYSSDVYDQIKDLRLDGKSDMEIAKICGIKEKALWKYTPYKKGMYNSDNPTKNALKIRKCREQKQG